MSEARKSEAAPAESDSKYLELFKASRDALLITEPSSGRFLSGNRSAIRLFGAQTEEDLLSYTPWEHSPRRQPDGRLSADKAREMIRAAVREGSVLFEWTHKRLDGTLFPAEILLTRFADREKTLILASVRDITERKSAEERMRLQADQQTTMLATTADGFCILDSAGTFLDANETYCRLSGYTREELLRLRIQDVQTVESREEADRHMAIIVNSGFDRFESRQRRKDGSLLDVEVSTSFSRNTGQFLSFVRDITERKRQEQKLRESEVRLTTVLNTTVDAIVVVDVETMKFSFANKAFFDLLGYNPEEVAAMGLADIHPPDQLAQIRAAFERNLRGEIGGITDLSINRKNGSRFFADLSGSPMILGGRTFMVGCFHDVTQRKIAADALAYRDRILHAVTIGAAGLIAQESIETGMSGALQCVGEAINVDRVLVLENSPDVGKPPQLRYCWQAPGIALRMDQAVLEAGSPTDSDAVSVWLAPLSEGKPVITDARSAEAPIRRLMQNLGNKSMLQMPIFAGDRFWGVVGIDECKSEREWTTTEIDLLATFAEIIGVVILRERTQRSLSESEERFRAVSETALDAIIVADSEGRVCYWNRAAERTLGYSADEAMGKSIHDWLAPQRFRDKAAQGMRELAATGRGPVLGKTLELAATRQDGIEIPIELAVNLMTIASQTYALGILRDISERKRAEEKIIDMVRRDSLTGLANRNVFAEAIDKEIIGVKQGDSRGFAVLYLDLDRFKDVNDTLGHRVGDLLLIAVAARLKGSVRETDLIARFGGDEFAIAVTDIQDPMEAARIAEQITSSIGEPFIIEGNEIRSGASVGISVYGADSLSTEELLSHADIALYRAKSEARGSHRLFTAAMDAEIHARVVLNGELHKAIESSQFFLMYQPQVDSDTGLIVGLEALVRWRHPKRGVVGPGLFIPEAEKSGLIVTLGHWVIREACHQTKQWLDAGIAPPLIGVNMSGVQFRKPRELQDDISAILAEFGLPPKCFELELTESVLMNVSEENNDMLVSLRKMGLRLAIDDFGSGYSSLDYLRRYPADRIKIAQTFIREIGIRSENDSIVRASIGLAHELGMKVVVEGVETDEQLALVRAWGAKIVQGFYFARPLSVADATAALRAGKITSVHANDKITARLDSWL